MWLRSTVLGSSRIACVMVPAVINEVRSCGILSVLTGAAVWLGNWIGAPPAVGVILTDGIVGAPRIDTHVPSASIVVPFGIDAIRARVATSAGFVVAGTAIQIPGSTWMPTG